MVCFLFWQGMRDSNPRKRSQSPVCYRYTNPLFAAHSLKRKIYYTQIFSFVKQYFYYFLHLFLSLYFPSFSGIMIPNENNTKEMSPWN